MPAPVSRIVPNTSRRTGMSPPIKNIPLASAGRALDGREDCAVALIVLVSFINFIFYLDSSCPLLGSHSTSVGLFNATGDGIRTPRSREDICAESLVSFGCTINGLPEFFRRED